MTKSQVVKILKITIISVLVLGIIFFLLYLNSVNNYKKSVKSMTFSNIDFTKIPDGTYTGDCNVNFIYAKVKVTVSGGVVTKIDLLEHKNERGTKAEKITDDIVRKQSLQVDTVSGATNSSKVIMKAVENALLQKQ